MEARGLFGKFGNCVRWRARDRERFRALEARGKELGLWVVAARDLNIHCGGENWGIRASGSEARHGLTLREPDA